MEKIIALNSENIELMKRILDEESRYNFEKAKMYKVEVTKDGNEKTYLAKGYLCFNGKKEEVNLNYFGKLMYILGSYNYKKLQEESR